MRKYGALPDKMMRGFIQARTLINGKEDNVGPCSYDVSLDNEMYRIRGIVRPRKNEHGKIENVSELIKRYHGKRIMLNDHPIEPGVSYLCKLKERLNLQEGVYAFANPKSTAGRLFLSVRLVADKVADHDTIRPAGYSGDLWVLITSRVFPIVLSEDDRLLQLRFFSGDARLGEIEMGSILGHEKLIRSRSGHCYTPQELGVRENEGACTLTLDFDSDPIGWEAVRSNVVLKYNKDGAYNPREFFRPVHLQGEYLHMQRGSRLILSSKELVRVPPYLACEMRPFDPRIAHFLSHGAGFIDPGWGWGQRGDSNGRPLTLEIETLEDDVILQRGDAAARIRFEYLVTEPDEHYDSRGSTYKEQSVAQLARQFKPPT